MNLLSFKALTFDCYGTLIDWESGILAELKPWVAASGRTLSDDQILEGFGEEESRCETATPSKLYPGILADTFCALGSRWGIAASEAQAAEFGRSVPRWPAFADSAAALAYLKQHYKLVILSNVDRASFAASILNWQSFSPTLSKVRRLPGSEERAASLATLVMAAACS